MAGKLGFVVLKIVQGELPANILKSHLEAEGIPVYLKYESAGIIYGITADGIGEVRIMVPKDFLEEARKIIQPVEIQKTENDSSGG
jgi:hypothetical protein